MIKLNPVKLNTRHVYIGIMEKLDNKLQIILFFIMVFDYILLICLFILFLFQPEKAPVSDDECFKSPECSNVGYNIKK